MKAKAAQKGPLGKNDLVEDVVEDGGVVSGGWLVKVKLKTEFIINNFVPEWMFSFSFRKCYFICSLKNM